MDDALLVCRFDSLGQLQGDPQRLVHGQRSVLQALGEIGAVDQFHGQGVAVVLGFETVDRRDARMVQRRQHLRLAAKARQALGMVGQALRQHLERDLAAEPAVGGPEDLTHGAGADLVGHRVVRKRP